MSNPRVSHGTAPSRFHHQSSRGPQRDDLGDVSRRWSTPATGSTPTPASACSCCGAPAAGRSFPAPTSASSRLRRTGDDGARLRAALDTMCRPARARQRADHRTGRGRRGRRRLRHRAGVRPAGLHAARRGFGVPVARTLGNCLSPANCARLVDLIGPARVKDHDVHGAPDAEAAEARALGLVTRLAIRPRSNTSVHRTRHGDRRQRAADHLARRRNRCGESRSAPGRPSRDRRPDRDLLRQR